jgi:hypothetical protein
MFKIKKNGDKKMIKLIDKSQIHGLRVGLKTTTNV